GAGGLLCASGAGETRLRLSQGSSQLCFKGADDALGCIIYLRLGERGFLTLKRDADHQRIKAGGNIFTAKEIARFDGNEFANSQRENGIANRGEACAVFQNERKIAVHSGEARDWFISLCGTRSIEALVEGLEFQFRKEGRLAQLEIIRDAP